MVAAKVKGEKLDKKLKKMEQNKPAARRYRQKKRAEQEALTTGGKTQADLEQYKAESATAAGAGMGSAKTTVPTRPRAPCA